MEADALDEDKVPAEEIETSIPNRPIASLRDIEVLYGALYTLGRGLTGPYGAYLTPDAAADQIGSEALVTIRIDVRGDEATLGNPAVEFEMLSEDLVPAVAHSKYSAAMGVDHSITHQSGQTNGPEKHADHAVERLSRWPAEDPVAETAASHDDGWLIELLADFGDDETVKQRIRERVTSRIDEEGQRLHTVAIAFDEDEFTVTDQYRDADWHYPGEIEVLQEAMAARKAGKFRAKNEAEDAAGEGTCFVFDTDETVYGVVDDPMKHYLSKQMEKFPAFDADESWRTQGLSSDAAIRAQNAETFLDACTVSAPGTSAFYLPYPSGEIGAEEARSLYELLVEQTEENDGDYSPVGELYHDLKQGGRLDELRFTLVIVNKYQKDRWRVLASTPTADRHVIEDVTKAHRDVLECRWLGDNGVFPNRENFALLSVESRETLSNIVASVGYLAETCLGEDADDPSSDDFRFRGTATIASGKPLYVDELLSEYVAKLSDRFDPDAEYPFPDATLAQQYVQFNALASCDLLTADDKRFEKAPDYMTNQQPTTTEQSRQETFEQFIDNHPALTDKTRQGVFALGALVGRVSRYQRSQDKSMTAVKRYPISNLTKHNVTRIATEVVESNVVYSEEEGYSQTMFGELMQTVADGLESGDPDEWSLSTDDLRFHYAMGIAYGKNDSSTSDYDNE